MHNKCSFPGKNWPLTPKKVPCSETKKILLVVYKWRLVAQLLWMDCVYIYAPGVTRRRDHATNCHPADIRCIFPPAGGSISSGMLEAESRESGLAAARCRTGVADGGLALRRRWTGAASVGDPGVSDGVKHRDRFHSSGMFTQLIIPEFLDICLLGMNRAAQRGYDMLTPGSQSVHTPLARCCHTQFWFVVLLY